MHDKTRILVLDDSEDTEDLFSQIFHDQITKREYEFSFANTSEKALQILQSQPHDIFISDISVNGTDIVELIEELRKQFSRMKFVIVSAYGDMNTLRAVMRAGAHDFVIKPIDIDDLVNTIAKTSAIIAKQRQAEATTQKFTAISNELDVSAKLQKSLLPGNFVRKGSIDLWADSVPAAEVGGDFYDFFWLSDTKLGIVMADVSGKNVSAAMFALMTKTLIKSCAHFYASPAKCFQTVNTTLCGENATTMFVTAMYGIVDTETNEITYTNAGHLPIASVLPGAETKFLECEAGMALGIWEETEFTDNVYKFSPGEMIMMYTDGVTEAANNDGDEFNFDRLADVLTTCSKQKPEQITEELVKAIRIFADGAPQSDDITTLCLKYRFRVVPNAN